MNSIHSSLPPSRIAFPLMGVVWLVLVCLHMLIRSVGGIVLMNEAIGLGAAPNSFVFGTIGLLFLGLTALSHWWLVRGLSRKTIVTGDGRVVGQQGPVGMVLVSMAIRFAGTFAILGSLLILKVVGRHEAVFDVLFWYVTLTTMEVGGIVWASRLTQCGGAGAVASRPDGV